jgi:hypothetical protein
MTRVSLPDNCLDDDCIKMLCIGLILNPRVTDLDVSSNTFGLKGCEALAKMLSTPPSIVPEKVRWSTQTPGSSGLGVERLSVANNELPPGGIKVASERERLLDSIDPSDP